MSREITLPAGATVRMSIENGRSVVTIAPAGVPCDMTTVLRTCPPAVHQILTHDAGVSWPDRLGCALATARLERGDGLVVAEFQSLGDALAFRKRLGEPAPAAANDQ